MRIKKKKIELFDEVGEGEKTLRKKKKKKNREKTEIIGLKYYKIKLTLYSCLSGKNIF